MIRALDSTFQCETADDAMDFVDLFPFPEKDLRVHARIEYVKRKKPKEHESLGYLRCSVENSERSKVDFKLRILPCAKLPSCLRQNIAVRMANVHRVKKDNANNS